MNDDTLDVQPSDSPKYKSDTMYITNRQINRLLEIATGEKKSLVVTTGTLFRELTGKTVPHTPVRSSRRSIFKAYPCINGGEIHYLKMKDKAPVFFIPTDDFIRHLLASEDNNKLLLLAYMGASDIPDCGPILSRLKGLVHAENYRLLEDNTMQRLNIEVNHDMSEEFNLADSMALLARCSGDSEYLAGLWILNSLGHVIHPGIDDHNDAEEFVDGIKEVVLPSGNIAKVLKPLDENGNPSIKVTVSIRRDDLMAGLVTTLNAGGDVTKFTPGKVMSS